jgi:osmotically-inducible protein OsmY
VSNAGSNAPAADNTGRNERDRDSATKTPIDQKNNEADTRITAEIRKTIVDKDDLSVNADNVKIVTEHGVVTLRGPVDSMAERDTIGSIASAVVGVVRVDNQLEVKN